jgi:RHS repeat-associated protein
VAKSYARFAAHVLKQYTWGLGYIDTPIARLRDIGADGTVDQTLYYVTDAQHNVTAMVAENGQVVERYAYDPYGRAIVLNGEGDPDGAEYTPDADGLSDVANVILFAGYRFDAATGLYQVRHRYHHPTLGRWINRDPKGYVDGMSLYEYVASRPMGATDPMGLGSFETMAKGLMAMVNPMYASMEYNKWIARSVLGDSEVEQTVKTALGAGASITSGEVVARPLAKGLKDEPVETVASLYVVVNPLHSTYSFVVDVAETHGQYSKMTAGSGASATDQAVGTGVLVLSRKTGVLSFAESFVWRESFSGEALSQDELDYRAATAAVKLGGTAYVATQGLKVAGQGLTRMGSRLKVRLAPSDAAARRAYLNNKFGRSGNLNADINGARGYTSGVRGVPQGANPRPPGWTSEWQWREGSLRSRGSHWWDPAGGEWRFHGIDKHHATPHWDYNAWETWNAPWRNVDLGGKPMGGG